MFPTIDTQQKTGQERFINGESAKIRLTDFLASAYTQFWDQKREVDY